MQTIKIEYGGEAVILTCDLAQASAPLEVDGAPIGYQTADARHSTQVAVLLAARSTWPEVEWPERPQYGSDIAANDAWDDLSFGPADA